MNQYDNQFNTNPNYGQPMNGYNQGQNGYYQGNMQPGWNYGSSDQEFEQIRQSIETKPGKKWLPGVIIGGSLTAVVVVLLIVALATGWFWMLGGSYTSESGRYTVEFTKTGKCTWYQDGFTFDGEYDYDKSTQSYILNVKGHDNYIDTTFTATKAGGRALDVDGGRINHEFFIKD